MVFDLNQINARAVAESVRRGALYVPAGGVPTAQRKRWIGMRPTVHEAMYGKDGAEPAHWAAPDVQAFVRRYMQGGRMIIVRSNTGLSTLPDFKPTQGTGPTIFEVRFSLEPHEPSQLRLFGRFIEMDAFIVTSHGEKGFGSGGKKIDISVSNERRKCQYVFQSFGFGSSSPSIERSLSNSRIHDERV